MKTPPSTPSLLLSVLAIAGFLVVGTLLAESRTWTQASTGRQLEGELSRINGEKILLIRKGGSSLEIPIAMLSEADKEFIEGWKKAKEPGAPAAGSGEPTASAEEMKVPEGPTTLVLSDAHSCCKGCYTAIEGSLGSLTGVEVDASKNEITIEGETGDLVKTALDYIMQRGFYGQPSIAAFADNRKYKTDEVDALYLSRIHLCCGACEKALTAAIESVDGVEDFTEPEKGVSEIKVEGKITQAAVMAALHEAGFHATVSPNPR